jgi:hypothetical protein
MADEIRNGDSKVRGVRLLGHRDDAGAWQIRDFLKRSVIEFRWIELSTEEDCSRELGLSDLKNVNLPVVELPDGTRLFGPTLRDVADRLGFVAKPKLRQYDVSISSPRRPRATASPAHQRFGRPSIPVHSRGSRGVLPGFRRADRAQGTLRPLRLSLDVAAGVGQRVEALGALRRRAAHGVGAALVPAQLVLPNHGGNSAPIFCT